MGREREGAGWGKGTEVGGQIRGQEQRERDKGTGIGWGEDELKIRSRETQGLKEGVGKKGGIGVGHTKGTEIGVSDRRTENGDGKTRKGTLERPAKGQSQDLHIRGQTDKESKVRGTQAKGQISGKTHVTMAHIIHSFIQQTSIECLPHTRHCAGCVRYSREESTRVP